MLYCTRQKSRTGEGMLTDYSQPGFYHADCMDAMRQFPDQFFDLAIVDPPYGDGGSEFVRGGVRFGQRFERYMTDAKGPARTGGTWASKYEKNIIAWDVAPDQDYFDELFRVSKHQIIWGGNYFWLPPTRCFLVWKKLTISESFSMAMAEYAWTNFSGNAKVFECAPQGTSKDQRFHPTQKPVALYQWQLGMFAKPGMKIIDTHVGSASSLVACHRAGLDYWGFEIDQAYYEKAKERLENELNQVNMNDLFQDIPCEQLRIL